MDIEKSNAISAIDKITFDLYELFAEAKTKVEAFRSSFYNGMNAYPISRALRAYYPLLERKKCELISKLPKNIEANNNSRVKKALEALNEQISIIYYYGQHSIMFQTYFDWYKLSNKTTIKEGVEFLDAQFQLLCGYSTDQCPKKYINPSSLAFLLDLGREFYNVLTTSNSAKFSYKIGPDTISINDYNKYLEKTKQKLIYSSEFDWTIKSPETWETLVRLAKYQIFSSEGKKIYKANLQSKSKTSLEKDLKIAKDRMVAIIAELEKICTTPNLKFASAGALSPTINLDPQTPSSEIIQSLIAEVSGSFLNQKSFAKYVFESFEMAYDKNLLNRFIITQGIGYFSQLFKISEQLRNQKETQANSAFINAYKDVADIYLDCLKYLKVKDVKHVVAYNYEEIAANNTKENEHDILRFYNPIEAEISRLEEIIKQLPTTSIPLEEMPRKPKKRQEAKLINPVIEVTNSMEGLSKSDRQIDLTSSDAVNLSGGLTSKTILFGDVDTPKILAEIKRIDEEKKREKAQKQALKEANSKLRQANNALNARKKELDALKVREKIDPEKFRKAEEALNQAKANYIAASNKLEEIMNPKPKIEEKQDTSSAQVESVEKVDILQKTAMPSSTANDSNLNNVSSKANDNNQVAIQDNKRRRVIEEYETLLYEFCYTLSLIPYNSIMFDVKAESFDKLAVMFNKFNEPVLTLQCYTGIISLYAIVGYNTLSEFCYAAKGGIDSSLDLLDIPLKCFTTALEYTEAARELAEHLMSEGTASRAGMNFVYQEMQEIFDEHVKGDESVIYKVNEVISILSSRLQSAHSIFYYNAYMGGIRCANALKEGRDVNSEASELLPLLEFYSDDKYQCEIYYNEFVQLRHRINALEYSVNRSESSQWVERL